MHQLGVIEESAAEVATVSQITTSETNKLSSAALGATWTSERPGLALTAGLHLQGRCEFDCCFGVTGACVKVPGGRAFALQASAGASFH